MQQCTLIIFFCCAVLQNSWSDNKHFSINNTFNFIPSSLLLWKFWVLTCSHFEVEESDLSLALSMLVLRPSWIQPKKKETTSNKTKFLTIPSALTGSNLEIPGIAFFHYFFVSFGFSGKHTPWKTIFLSCWNQILSLCLAIPPLNFTMTEILKQEFHNYA